MLHSGMKIAAGTSCTLMVDFAGLVTNIRSTDSFTGDCERRCLMMSKENQPHYREAYNLESISTTLRVRSRYATLTVYICNTL